MKYKEFIQAVDSLTNDALVSDNNAIPWKVNVKRSEERRVGKEC